MSEGKQSAPSSNNQQIKLDGFSFNLTANGEGSSSVRRNENGNFVLRFSLQNAKDFVLSSSSSPRQLKFKLPLKLKISTPVENNQANNSQTPNLSSQNKHTKLHSQNNGLKKQVQHYHAALPVASSVENHNNTINLHHNQDLVKQTQIQILPYKTVEEFLDAVTAQSTSNKSYSLLMDSHLINQLISIRKQFYFNYDGLKESLFLLLSFLALSKNYSGAKPSLKSSLSIQSFAEQLGFSCRRIRDQAYNKNKNVLKIMDYIQPKGETDGSRYNHCYFTLKFDFSEEEVSKVAMATKYASRYNHKAFCFLTNYLFKSCLLLQNNNVGIMEIEDRLVNTISVLLRNHPPSQPLQGDDSLLKKHPTQSVPSSEYPIQQLDLKNIPKQKRVEKLQSFISQRAKEAQKNSKHFFRLIFDVCSKRGESLVTGIKIKNMRKRKAINRIKQKFFHSLSNKNHSQIQLQVNPNLSLQNYTKEELRQYKQSLNTIFSKMDEKINFGVDDLLRGRCIFSSIDSLNSCCSQLKQQIVKRGFKLLALLNRLHQQTCDIVLHIQIGKTIAQLQLVINHKLSQNQFNYKLRFLSQASFYNHITHLKAYNQKMSELFVEESLRYIQANFAAYNRVDYKQKTNYQSSLINLKRFIKQSPFQFNREEMDLNQMEIPMFAQEINYFQHIKAATAGPITVPSFELQKNNGDFLQEIGEIDKAEKYEQEYCQKVKEHHRDVLDKIKYGLVVSDNDQSVANNYAGALYVLGKIFKNKRQYAKSVQKFEESQAIVQHSGQKKEHVIESLGLIGQVHHKNGKLNESVKVYQRSLSFQQTFKGGNKTEDYVNTLLSLGLVYKQQGNYSQALKNLKKGLSIYESNNGKDHILLSNIYNQIASIQLLEGDLVGGLKNFKNTLDIIQKQKGKNSFDCSVVLANIGLIYESDQNYYEAINNYEKAMIICSTHNLREQVYANSSYGLGKCYFSLKNHTKAMQYFINSLSHFRKQKTQIYYTIIENIAQCNDPLKSIQEQ